MMKTKFIITALMLSINSVILFGQMIYGPSNSDLRRNLYSIDYGAAQSSGLLGPTTNIMVGTRNYTGGSDLDRSRALYQWNLDDSKIPDNSEIISINLSFDYDRLGWYTPSMCAYFFSIEDDLTDPDLQQIFDYMFHPREMFSAEQTSFNKFNLTFNDPEDPDFIAFSNAIIASLINDRFTLGISECTYYDDHLYVIITSTVKLTIEFTPPTNLVTIYQRISNNQQVGVLKKWDEDETDWSQPFNPGSQFYFQVFSPQTILGDQTIQSSEKYNNWNFDMSDVRNHHTFTITPETSELTSRFEPPYSEIKIKKSLEGTTLIGGDIQFFDPWYIDFQDPNFAYQWRNRGMEEPQQFYNRSVGASGWQPDFTTIYQQGPYPYNGVFLNQDYNDPDVPYYKVGMLTEQLITVNGQERKFFPYKWTGTGVTFQEEYARQTGVVFTTTDATATAVLKGQLMSNDQNGVKNPSQRKMVRTDNGQYHVVYESMGTVWYTYSLTSDFYGAWSPDEYLHYHGKNPAIDYDENRITIVFEEYDPQVGGNAKIWLYGYIPVGNGIYEQWNTVDLATYPNSYYGNAKPVVAFNTYYDYGEIFVAYRTNFTEGIKYKTVWIEENLWWSYSDEDDIPGTNCSCINPSVTGQAGASSSNYVHIAYEQLSSIYYIYAHRGGYYWDFISSPRNLSSDCGFNYNSYPAISITLGSVNNYVMVSWQGIYDAQHDSPIPKETGGSEPLRRVAAVVKTGWGPSWGTSSSFSDNVDFTNNGSINMGFGSIMAWSESNGQYSKYVRRRSPLGYDAITPLSDNGIHTLVSNGSGFGDIKAMVFNKSTNAPYFLNRCTDDFTYIPDGMGKLTESGVVDISYGRSGIIEKNGIEFVFNIGDVLLNGETIKFIERADTLPVSSIEELNLSVRTYTLTLTQQSELIFSDYYYVVNGERADSMLSSEFSVHFNCELVKLSTGEVIGLFEQVNYNRTNVEEFGHQGYLVDCSGIEAGDYYLRLTSSVNEEVGLSLSDIQMDNIVLEKSKLNVRNFKGETLPIEYSLDQNYPNPFNPATTIRYQLPKDGMVTLKVYDILGVEVATLVNEEKVAGKYEVSFNASSHASGVYIYRLQANDFISVKKMVLLK